MIHPIRPVKTFILRLWREPGAQEGDAGWRGLIRPLDAEEGEMNFQGLDNLTDVLRQLLDQEGALTSHRGTSTNQEPEEESGI